VKEPASRPHAGVASFGVATFVFVLWYSGLLHLGLQRFWGGATPSRNWWLYGVGAVFMVIAAIPAIRSFRREASVQIAGALRRSVSTLFLVICYLWWPLIHFQRQILGFGFPGIDFLIPVIGFVLVVRKTRVMPEIGWLNLGRWDRTSGIITSGLVIVSGATLIGWAAMGAETIVEQAAGLLSIRRALWIPAAVGFAVTNAVAEEMIFRGAIWDALRGFVPTWVVIAITSVLFAALHLYGFPSGPTGMIMVLAWGIVLGVLRFHSRGMMVPILGHIGADLVIFGILAVKAARMGG
jgi:membrane protease YdiL (CAAX protease family)